MCEERAIPSDGNTVTEHDPTEQLGLLKLTKDMRKLAASLDIRQVRCMVNSYYTLQKNRMREQLRTGRMVKDGKPHEVLLFFQQQNVALEKQMATILKCWADSDPMGRWAQQVCGIGPIISAGLSAFIDLEPWKCAVNPGTLDACKPDAPCSPQCRRHKIPTVGHVWRFAGQDPTTVWEKGGKRPHCAALKTLVWKVGESFVKVKGNPASLYGKLYDRKKAEYHAKNDAGGFAERAAQIAKDRPRHAQIKTYKEGRLPDGHMHAMAKRYAAKIFLSHWFEQAYWFRWGEAPPKPFAIEHGGHAHYIEPEVPFTKEGI